LIKDHVFYTRTMAKVYADQGNLEKATEIYNYLLECEPGRQDLMDALADIERKRLEKNSERLERLLGRWLDLLLTYNRKKKLRKFKNYLKNSR